MMTAVTGPRVAVIGAGNVGCALAADLTIRGADVRLWNRSEARIKEIGNAGGMTLTGKVEGFAPLAVLTTDLAEAVGGADIVAVTLPTTALPSIAPGLTDTTTDQQLLWLNPGHSGGALYLGAEIRRRRADRRPLICQVSTSSHGARMAGPATVGVFVMPAVKLAAFPTQNIDQCHARLDALLPGQFSPAGHVLELDLQNINAVMHPPQMVTNASWIEATGGDLPIYQEGSGPSTSRVIAAIDGERIALADRLGVPTIPMTQALAEAGYTTAEAAAAGVHRALQEIGGIKAPPSLDHRYLHEDVGWGLVQWLHLAAVAGVPTPTIDAVTTLAGVCNGIDYRRAGLTLERMGMFGLGPDEIVPFARDGLRA